jgi:hypothetical protein
VSLHVLGFLPSFHFIGADAVFSLDQERPSVFHDLYMLDFLIYNLFLDQRLLHVHIEYPYEPAFIRDIQFLVLIIPKDTSVNCFIRVLDAKELTAIGSIKTFKLLIETYSKHKVGLHYHKDLNYTYAVDTWSFLGQFEHTIVAPIFWRSESQH